MTLKVVGAGLGRTGTMSLKAALEQLLGGPCYHMMEVFEHPEHVAIWNRALSGETVEWSDVYAHYVATVDYPNAAVWEPLAAAYPDALVLLSSRDAAGWWKSASNTIIPAMQRAAVNPDLAEWSRMVTAFGLQADDPEASMALFDAHNAHVRATVPAARLIDWQPGDGWEPICEKLGVSVPSDPFPHVNTTDEFRTMQGLDGS